MIKFSNDTQKEYIKYQLKEKKLIKPNYNKIIKQFTNNLKRNIKKIERFNFITSINIKEGKNDKFIIINFQDKKIYVSDKNIKNQNLNVQIQSYKIRNLLLSKYPMNFLTFHNGGYSCERKLTNLTSNEKKYWSWINELDFFI